MLAKTGWLTGEKAGHVLIYIIIYHHSKHVKGMTNYLLKKFTPLGHVSYVAAIYFGHRREREQQRG